MRGAKSCQLMIRHVLRDAGISWEYKSRAGQSGIWSIAFASLHDRVSVKCFPPPGIHFPAHTVVDGEIVGGAPTVISIDSRVESAKILLRRENPERSSSREFR